MIMTEIIERKEVLAIKPMTERQIGFHLFLVGFLVLFFELACIRWFAAYVVFLQFFTNVALIASFLGMSCGCLAARSRRDWLAYFPTTMGLAVVAALSIYFVYHLWSGMVIEVGHQISPQQVFFGTGYRNPNVAKFTVPIELVMAVFFIMIAMMFVGLGQVLGRSFDAYTNRIWGYTLNISGSLAGIICFSVLSMLQTPAWVWFLIVAIGVAYLLRQMSELNLPKILLLAAVPLVTASPGIHDLLYGINLRWSPYYAVIYNKTTRNIIVDNIPHQTIVPFERAGSPYSLIYLLQKHSGGRPFHDVLIIGAGSGNDIAHALHFGVNRIDAVEIDPVIREMGVKYHPDRPYQDPRVIPHIDDGRHFLRTTNHKYDLVIYALVDSLVLHSSYANIRLESYLFTREAFQEIKRVMKPNGVFVTYNYFRQGWIVERIATMAQHVFGCKPIVLTFPSQPVLKASERAGDSMVITTCNKRIADAFAAHKRFWLNEAPSRNLNVNGFALKRASLPPDQQSSWDAISPTTLVYDEGSISSATDNWPFLYLHRRLIPYLTIRSTLLMGIIGLIMVYLFLPKDRNILGNKQLNTRMFFLGAGFMLLETKAVVQLALLFGSTWLVNSLVFATVLILILLANLYVQGMKNIQLIWHYGALLVLLGLGAFVPTDLFIAGGPLWHYALPAGLALGPMLFAGVIFAHSFMDAVNPDHAFGANIAGAVVGGLCEAFSMLLGFRYLLLLAALFYILSAWRPAQSMIANESL